MTTQHTTGPWHFSGDYLTHRQFNIYAPTQAPQQHVCTINNLPVEKLYTRDAGVALANARLIASAPDLLAALRELVADNMGQPKGVTVPQLDKARAAIAKATGDAA